MLPTMTIPSVHPPQPASEQPGATAHSEGGDGFAQLLQRAQAEPDAAPTRQPRGPAPKAAEGHTKPTQHVAAKRPADDSDASPPSGHPECADDLAAIGTRAEPTLDDAAPGHVKSPQDGLMLPPIVAADVAAPPQTAAIATSGATALPVATDADPSLTAADGRADPARFSLRIGAHEPRAGSRAPSAAALPGQAMPGAGDVGAMPPHTTAEHTTHDAAINTATTAALRAAPLEHSPGDAATPLSSTILLPRELNSTATSRVDFTGPQATLHSAIDEPGFGAAVGTQVALWVRDGVQEARLQLHPAELGPVTVQIALDGRAAHVDFTAAVAATRESIEQSLPALAAALRESGFTLAGGGVSSQAGQPGGDGRRERAPAGHGDHSRPGAAIGAGDAAVAPRRWTRSLLDVYA